MADEADAIGTIRFPDGRTAMLDKEGEWHCDYDVYEMHLNSNFKPRDFSVLSMPYGWNAVCQAAVALGGKAEFPRELPSPDPDMLY